MLENFFHFHRPFLVLWIKSLFFLKVGGLKSEGSCFPQRSTNMEPVRATAISGNSNHMHCQLDCSQTSIVLIRSEAAWNSSGFFTFFSSTRARS